MTRHPFDQEQHGIGGMDAESYQRLQQGEKPGIDPVNVAAWLGVMAVILLTAAVAIAVGIRITDWVAGWFS